MGQLAQLLSILLSTFFQANGALISKSAYMKVDSALGIVANSLNLAYI